MSSAVKYIVHNEIAIFGAGEPECLLQGIALMASASWSWMI
jgi:hypothetical protein